MISHLNARLLRKAWFPLKVARRWQLSPLHSRTVPLDGKAASDSVFPLIFNASYVFVCYHEANVIF